MLVEVKAVYLEVDVEGLLFDARDLRFFVGEYQDQYSKITNLVVCFCEAPLCLLIIPQFSLKDEQYTPRLVSSYHSFS